MTYVIYDLTPSNLNRSFAPMALFIVSTSRLQLLCARLVTPTQDGVEVEVSTLYQLEEEASDERT